MKVFLLYLHFKILIAKIVKTMPKVTNLIPVLHNITTVYANSEILITLLLKSSQTEF